ncbi:hypothetical protein [Eupransor demetentiae]|uniref:Integral membrane protein n=1 Tax=Eupransor demetentiae TaxID=3109584 RepID=A0ABP0EQT5_9LACO|nr:hypothetical protein R54876_GBNLAHCA_00369 [Lactobacillaceae bacterium LMG 33000]
MSTVKKFLKRFDVQQGLWIIFLAYLLPQFAQWFHWRYLFILVWICFIINGLYALYFGYQIRRRGLAPWWLLAQPLLFALLTTWLCDLVSTNFGYYFSIFYLILSLFTFLGDTRDDPDENLIPIENGFHDLGD